MTAVGPGTHILLAKNWTIQEKMWNEKDSSEYAARSQNELLKEIQILHI